MISSLIVLLLNSAFLTLRLGGNGGSFPRPLSAEDERHYLALAAEGDEEARAVLIERNLRLVAHIVKKLKLQQHLLMLEDFAQISSGT